MYDLNEIARLSQLQTEPASKLEVENLRRRVDQLEQDNLWLKGILYVEMSKKEKNDRE